MGNSEFENEMKKHLLDGSLIKYYKQPRSEAFMSDPTYIALENFQQWIQQSIDDMDVVQFIVEDLDETDIFNSENPDAPKHLFFDDIDEEADGDEDEEVDDEELSDEEMSQIHNDYFDDEIANSYESMPAVMIEQITPEFINKMHAIRNVMPEWMNSHDMDLLIAWLSDIYEYHNFIQGK